MHHCFDLRFAGELCGKGCLMNKEVAQNFNCMSMASVSSEKPYWVFAIICDNKLVTHWINSGVMKALLNSL